MPGAQSLNENRACSKPWLTRSVRPLLWRSQGALSGWTTATSQIGTKCPILHVT
jgi:hypothetical protein